MLAEKKYRTKRRTHDSRAVASVARLHGYVPPDVRSRIICAFRVTATDVSFQQWSVRTKCISIYYLVSVNGPKAVYMIRYNLIPVQVCYATQRPP